MNVWIYKKNADISFSINCKFFKVRVIKKQKIRTKKNNHWQLIT